MKNTAEAFESQELLEALFHYLPIGLFVIDSDQKMIFANKRMEEILGWEGDMSGVSFMDFFPKGKSTDLYDICEEHFKSACQAFHTQVGLVDTSGRGFKALIHGAPFQSASGKTLLVGTLCDVTAEENLRLNKEAADKILLHDLKSPLSGIMGLAQLLRLELPDHNEASALSETLLKRCSRVLHRMESHLAFNRIESGVFDLVFEQVDLEHLVYSALSHWDEVREKAGLHWNFEPENLPQQTLWFISNPTLLVSILEHLIQNALESAPSGTEIKIVATFDDVHNLDLTVANKGTIAKDLLVHLFSPLDIASKTGKGMGLYTARRFAQALGGEIECLKTDSEVVFHVHLPNGEGKNYL